MLDKFVKKRWNSKWWYKFIYYTGKLSYEDMACAKKSLRYHDSGHGISAGGSVSEWKGRQGSTESCEDVWAEAAGAVEGTVHKRLFGGKKEGTIRKRVWDNDEEGDRKRGHGNV